MTTSEQPNRPPPPLPSSMQTSVPVLAVTGGGRIGWAQATWPFVRLTATKELLVIGAGIIGRYPFRPEDVVGIERAGCLGWGIRINHNVPRYPRKIIFSGFDTSDRLIDNIARVGFVPAGAGRPPPLPAEARDVGGWGCPFPWWLRISGVLVWSALALADIATWPMPGKYTLAALALLFVLSAGLLFCAPLQRMALKQGHRVGPDLRISLYFFLLISGFGLLVVGVVDVLV